MIAYDHEALEALLGGPVPPIDQNDELGRMTARALLDSRGNEDVGNSSTRAAALFCNALYWIAQAEQSGRYRGRREGHNDLAQHIRTALKL